MESLETWGMVGEVTGARKVVIRITTGFIPLKPSIPDT